MMQETSRARQRGRTAGLLSTSLRWLMAGVVGVSLSVVGGMAWAIGPTEALKGDIDRALMVLTDKALKDDSKAKERRKKLEEIVSTRFSYEELTKRVLGARWPKLEPNERTEVVGLFRELLIKTYADRVEAYSGEPVNYISERVEKARETEYAEVRTKAKVGAADVPIDYRLINVGDQWVVYDMVIDEISLVSNYRSQFKKILATGSYQDLVTQLRKKTESHAGAGGSQ
ncbi:MAG: ABC transporter substrate-binding protein [Nitrospiraceae bacterium]